MHGQYRRPDAARWANLLVFCFFGAAIFYISEHDLDRCIVNIVLEFGLLWSSRLKLVSRVSVLTDLPFRPFFTELLTDRQVQLLVPANQTDHAQNHGLEDGYC